MALNEKDYAKHSDLGFLGLLFVLFLGLLIWGEQQQADRLCALEAKAGIVSGFCK